VIRRVDSEAVVLLGGGRALLMQVAHPMVARAVSEHSKFEANPYARLQRTLGAVYTVVFGTTEQAERAARAIGRVHEGVTGPEYRADDPALLLWVHATLVDTALYMQECFLSPLDAELGAQYYQEATLVGEAFGVPRDQQPPDLDAFRAYVATMVERLAAGLTDDSRRVAKAVLHPRLPAALRPVMAVARELSTGLLPVGLRDGFDLRWTPRRQAALDALAWSGRAVLPHVPAVVRRVPTGRIIRASGY
jgi:uncharacterized protein (DUF2236 family)